MWLLIGCLLLAYKIDYSLAHGRLMEPAARNTLWRLNFASPPYFDDTELFCGGIKVSETVCWHSVLSRLLSGYNPVYIQATVLSECPEAF